MADEKTLEILLKIRSDMAELQKVIGGLKEVKTSVDEAAKSGFSLGDAFKFAGAEEGLRRMIDFLKQVPEALFEGLKAGIEFDAQMQQVQVGLASILRFTQPENFTSFGAAMQQAAGYVDLLKQKANDLGRPMQEFIEGFEHAQLAMSSITPEISKQISLYTSMSLAMQAMSISGSRASRDIADLFRGMAQNTAAGSQMAAGLHMTVAELDNLIKKHIAAGDALQFFLKLFSAFGEGATAASNTFEANGNRLKNLILELEGEAAKPIMQPLVDAMHQIDTAASSENLKAYARTIGDMAEFFIKEAEGLAQVAVKLGDINNTIAKYSGIQLFPEAGLFTSAKNAELAKVQTEEYQKQADLLLQQTLQAGTQVEKGTALGKIVKEIYETGEQIHSGQAKNIAAANDFVAALNLLLSKFDQVAGTAAIIAAPIRESAKALEAEKEIRDKIQLLTDQAAGDKEAVAADRAKLAYEEVLKSLLAKEVPEAKAKKDAQDYADAVEQAALHATHLKDEQRDVTEFTREQALVLQEVRNAQDIISKNPFLSVDEKQVLLIPLIGSEIQSLNQQIKNGEALMHGGTLDPTQYARVAAEVSNLKTHVTELGFELKKLSFGGELQAGLVQWVNQFGSAAHQVASIITGTLNAAISGTSQAITGLIFGTKTWQQAFAQAAQSIVQNIIQIALQYVVSKIIMAAIDKLTGGQSSQTATQAASQAAAAWAPAAYSASVASYGAAAGWGLGAYLTGLGVAEGAAIGISAVGTGAGAGNAGFQRGGFTGHGAEGEYAGPAHRMEYIFGAEAVRTLGVPFLEKLHSAGRGGMRMHEGGMPDDVTSTGGGWVTWQGAGGVQYYYNQNSGESYTGAPPIGGIDIPPADMSPGEFGTQPPARGSAEGGVRIPGTDLIYDPGTGLTYSSSDFGSRGSGLTYSSSGLTSSSTSTGSDIPTENYYASAPPMPNVPPDDGSNTYYPQQLGFTILPGGQIGGPEGRNTFGDYFYRRGGSGVGPHGSHWARTGTHGGDLKLAVHGMHTGGLAEDEFLAILQSGEFTQQRSAVSHYGVEAMRALNDRRIPISNLRLHTGGPIMQSPPGAAGSQGSIVKLSVFAFTDMKALQKAVVQSDANQNFIIDTVNGKAIQLGIAR